MWFTFKFAGYSQWCLFDTDAEIPKSLHILNLYPVAPAINHLRPGNAY